MAVLSNVMFLLILAIAFSLCSSQELVVDDNCDDDTGNCSDVEVASCISEYNQLDLYILNNKTLLRILTETFFKTGGGPSQFIKFTYNFQITNSRNSSEDDSINCTNHQTTYVWSTSVLYLLGPWPLFWQTFLAVDISETSATIELPCFCTDDYADLLARLTYLVCTYIAT